MAHTPGPWTLGNNEGFWAADCCVMAIDPVLEAPVVVAEVVHTTAAEETDNLRLICAAPDLLAACEELVNHTLEMYASGGESVEAIIKARAAIAKAKGD
jgi:hypothetical protein